MATTIKTRRTIRNPTGRIDWLVMAITDRVVERHMSNPVAKAVYQEFKPELETLARKYLGPGNPRAKRVRDLIVRLRKEQDMARGKGDVAKVGRIRRLR